MGIASVVAVVVIALVAAVLPFKQLAAAIIFAASYLALAIGKIPGLSIDRAGVALVGAGLMVASGRAVDRGRVPGDRPRHASRCCSA